LGIADTLLLALVILNLIEQVIARSLYLTSPSSTSGRTLFKLAPLAAQSTTQRRSASSSMRSSAGLRKIAPVVRQFDALELGIVVEKLAEIVEPKGASAHGRMDGAGRRRAGGAAQVAER
jgi:hypothetical protein